MVLHRVHSTTRVNLMKREIDSMYILDVLGMKTLKVRKSSANCGGILRYYKSTVLRSSYGKLSTAKHVIPSLEIEIFIISTFPQGQRNKKISPSFGVKVSKADYR